MFWGYFSKIGRGGGFGKSQTFHPNMWAEPSLRLMACCSEINQSNEPFDCAVCAENMFFASFDSPLNTCAKQLRQGFTPKVKGYALVSLCILYFSSSCHFNILHRPLLSSHLSKTACLTVNISEKRSTQRRPGLFLLCLHG